MNRSSIVALTFFGLLVGSGCELITAVDGNKIAGSGGGTPSMVSASGGAGGSTSASHSSSTTAAGGGGAGGGLAGTGGNVAGTGGGGAGVGGNVASTGSGGAGVGGNTAGTGGATASSSSSSGGAGVGTGGAGGSGGDACVPVNDNNPCTDDVCENGAPANKPTASGTACNGTSLCDGAGQCVECLAATDCKGQDTDCQKRTCTAGQCGTSFTAAGTAIPIQTTGDCQQTVCDGAGSTQQQPSDADVPSDNNPCTDDVCTAGVPSNPLKDAGTSCGTGSAPLFCDASGTCTGCNTATDCAGTDDECKARTCTAGQCGSSFTAAGTPVAAQTAGDCRKQECDGAGNSTSAADDTDLPADDGNACTNEVCTAGTPSHPAKINGSGCTDGNACTLGDSCQAGTCTAGSAVTCVAQDQCHDAGTCDSTTGICSNPVKSNGSTCNDGNACTSSDVCTGGVCGGTSHTCTPTSCQTSSTCDGNGGCTIVNAGNGTSCPGDGNPCTSDACDGNGNCTHPASSDGTSCGTGQVCSAGGCASDCFIGGTLYASGAVNPANACQVCTPATSTTDWSNGPDGTSCGTSLVCGAGSCASDCFIGGTLYTSGTGSPTNACQVCTPEVSTTTWSDEPDGTSCGSALVCSVGTCESGCFISGTVYAAGTLNPTNACQVCTPGASTTDWSDEPDSSTCSGGNLIIPSVVTTSPQDGATPVAGTTISITFNTAMDPTTLTAQTSAGACSGSVQVSHDGFGTCISFASAAPVMSAGNTVATFIAAPGLLVNRSYGIIVASSAASAVGLTMTSDYTTASGFKTVSPVSPVVQNESGSSLEVSFCDMQFPSSYTGNVNDTVTMYGQIYEIYNGNQITGTGTQSSMITAQFGYAPANADGSPLSNPEYEAAWTWADAIYNGQHYIDTHDGNDEYMFTLTLPPTGYYTYTYRFSLDGGASWTYCDVGGAGSNSGLEQLDFNLLSQLKVN